MKLKTKILLIIAAVIVIFAVALAGVNIAANSGEKIPILMYHHLVPDDVYTEMNYESNGSVITTSDFEEQMSYLHDNGYQTYFMSELLAMLQSDEPLPEKAVVLTFDDGYESNYVYAHPILQKYNLKANIAPVVKSSEDITAENQKPYTDYDTPHLSFAQLQEMQESGVWEIGSHSYDGHGEITIDNKGKTGPFLNNHMADPETKEVETDEEYLQRITDDLAISKKVLDDNLGEQDRFFVYPFGRYNKDLYNVVKNTGFSCAVTTQNGYAKKNSDLYALPRLGINNDVKDLGDFITIVSGKAKCVKFLKWSYKLL